MNRICFLLVVFGGCVCSTADTVSIGISKEKVIEIYGVPDVISERSGDLQRFYKGDQSPAYKWPKSAITEYYYLNMNKVIIIQSNKVASIGSISNEEAERVLKLAEKFKD